MSDTVTSTEAVAAPEYPMERSGRCPFAPPPEVMELAAAAPLSRVRIWDGSRPWLITGYEEARALFADSRVSVDDRKPGFPHWNEHMLATVDKRPRSVFTADAEEHTFYRRMLSKPFTFKRVEALRPAIQKITDDAIDKILAGPKPAELVTALALPVPTEVICEMLGVPVADRDRFTTWTAQATHALAGKMAPPEVQQRAQAAAMALGGYFTDLIEERRNSKTDDLLSEMIRAEEEGDRLTHSELVVQSIGLLIAGFETTIGLIGNGVAALARNPGEAQKLRARRELVPNAVEECLRYEGPIGMTLRVLHEDATFGGRTIPVDTEVWAMLWGANRDPEVFPDPDRFDVERANARDHLAFGGGAHLCLGAHLARMESQVAIGTLVARARDIELADDRIEWGPSLFRVPARLPVTFRPV